MAEKSFDRALSLANAAWSERSIWLNRCCESAAEKTLRSRVAIWNGVVILKPWLLRAALPPRPFLWISLHGLGRGAENEPRGDCGIG